MFDRRPGVRPPVTLSDWMQRRLIRPVWVPFLVFALSGYLGWRLRDESMRWLWMGCGLAVLLGAASVLNVCWRPHLRAGAAALLLGVLLTVWPVVRAARAAESEQMRSLTGVVLQSDIGADQAAILAEAAGDRRPMLRRETLRHQQIVAWTAVGRVHLRLTDEPLYRIGEVIQWQTAVRRVPGAANPGGFETDRWLAGQHVFLEAEPPDRGEAVRSPGLRLMLIRTWAAAGRWGRRARIWFCGRILYWMGYSDGAVLCGMLTGVTGLMAPDDLAGFRHAGLAHLFAVSGAHTQILLSGCMSVLAMAGPSHRLRQWIKLPVLLGFGCVTGWPVSVSRAVLSQLLGMCGAVMRRRTDRLNHLLVSSLLILLVRPFAVLQTGFWMSVSVSFALLTIPTADEPGRLGFAAGRRPGVRALAAAAAAAGTSLPFSLFLSAAVPILSIPANLLALPLATWMITAGLLLGTVSVLPVLPGWMGQALGRAVQLMRLLSSWSSRLTLTVPDPVRLACLLALLTALLIWRRTTGGRLRRRGGACLLLLMLFGAVRADAWLSAAIQRPGAELTVWFLDVGQGDCILIRCGGRHYLIDGGTERAGNDQVMPALDALGIDRIDLAMVSHLDQDHAGGMIPLLKAGRIDNLVMPSLPSVRSVALSSAAETGGAMIRTLRRGDVIRAAAGLNFTVLWPETYRDGGNADSLVLRASRGDFDLLLTGDISDQEERLLLTDGAQLDCEMLKVTHHGTRHGSSAAFLRAVTPVCAAIQCGVHNRYGHPAAETLRRLQAAGSAVFRCDRGGCIVAAVYPDHFKVYNWQQPALVYSYAFEPD